MKTIYIRGVAVEVDIPCKSAVTNVFEVHKQHLSYTVESRIDMATRVADRQFSVLGAARSGRTPVAAAYAEQVGYAGLEKQRAGIKAAAEASYEADVKAYEAWIKEVGK